MSHAWFSAPPSTWRVHRMREAAILTNGFPFSSDLFSKLSGKRLIRIRDLKANDDPIHFVGDWLPPLLVRDGDVLVGMDGDFNVCWWAGGEALLNQRVCRLRARPGFDLRYLYYLLPLPLKIINDLTYFTTVKHISSGQVLAIRFPAPALAKQCEIVAFLDRKTAAIDQLIQKKERLIDLLQEKRQALIAQAVTKGLDPSVPMKDTGISRLGRVPSHWQIVSLRRVARLEQGHAFAHSRQGQASGDYPWFKVADMNREGNEVELRSADNYVTRDVAQEAGAILLPAGATAFPRVGAALLTNKRRLLIQPSIVDDNTYALVPGGRIRPRYLYLVMLLVDMGSLCSPGLVPTVTFDAVKDLRVALPPVEEQDRIVLRVEAQVKVLSAAAERTAASVERLREYRQALISAGVTGQIDVTTEAA